MIKHRFTVDGSAALEQRVQMICDRVRDGVKRIIPGHKLEAIVLGGGYGRGEGGVLRTEHGEEPYNDIEFYVFLRGSRLWNQQKYRGEINTLGETLSDETGLHVEFKMDSLQRLQRMPTCMFTYDLVSAHYVLLGPENVFKGCEHHLDGSRLPLSEATRLLFNRCSGLLLVRELLARKTITPEESDFIGRNLAKAQLALGDAILTIYGLYHWSASTRDQRLAQFETNDDVPQLPVLKKHHGLGLEFKLHPRRILKAPPEFAAEHRELSSLARQLWLWIESRRLGQPFSNIGDYALSEINKCPETLPAKNYLLSMRTFGPGSALQPLAGRYPRERLFNSMPLLLWNGEVSGEPEIQRHLQKQLGSKASDWSGLVAAYKEIWPGYG